MVVVELDLHEQKLEIDSFSHYKIYPGKGRLFVRGDSKVRFLSSSFPDFII